MEALQKETKDQENLNYSLSNQNIKFPLFLDEELNSYYQKEGMTKEILIDNLTNIINNIKQIIDILKEIKKKKKNNSNLHIMGLLSDGGVHSHITHLYAIIDMAKREKIKNIYIHCFMDGRDTEPDSGINFIRMC